jgi:hypothetical protein
MRSQLQVLPQPLARPEPGRRIQRQRIQYPRPDMRRRGDLFDALGQRNQSSVLSQAVN